LRSELDRLAVRKRELPTQNPDRSASFERQQSDQQISCLLELLAQSEATWEIYGEVTAGEFSVVESASPGRNLTLPLQVILAALGSTAAILLAVAALS